MHSFSVSNISYNAQQIYIKLLISIIFMTQNTIYSTAKYDTQIYLTFTNLITENSIVPFTIQQYILFFHFQTNKILFWLTGLLLACELGRYQGQGQQWNKAVLSSEQVPSWILLMAAVSIFLYQTCDALDGAQGRRTGQDFPTEEIFDHGCDSVSNGETEKAESRERLLVKLA